MLQYNFKLQLSNLIVRLKTFNETVRVWQCCLRLKHAAIKRWLLKLKQTDVKKKKKKVG